MFTPMQRGDIISSRCLQNRTKKDIFEKLWSAGTRFAAPAEVEEAVRRFSFVDHKTCNITHCSQRGTKSAYAMFEFVIGRGTVK